MTMRAVRRIDAPARQRAWLYVAEHHGLHGKGPELLATLSHVLCRFRTLAAQGRSLHHIEQTVIGQSVVSVAKACRGRIVNGDGTAAERRINRASTDSGRRSFAQTILGGRTLPVRPRSLGTRQRVRPANRALPYPRLMAALSQAKQV